MTELSDGLVRLEGIDFRTAYEIGSALARGLVARGAGMSALPGAEIAAAFLAAVGRPPALDLLELERLASVENFIAVRNRIGGPAPAALAAALADLESANEALTAAAEARARAAKRKRKPNSTRPPGRFNFSIPTRQRQRARKVKKLKRSRNQPVAGAGRLVRALFVGRRKVEKLNGWGRVVDGKVAAPHLAHCLATDSPSVLLGHWRSFAEQARHLACREVRPVPVPMNSL